MPRPATGTADHGSNVLAAHLNSYHTHPLDAALAGIAAAGYRAVELCAPPPGVEGGERGRRMGARLASHGLDAVALSGHTDLGHDAGVAAALRNLRLAADHGVPLMTTCLPTDLEAAGGRSLLRRRLDTLIDEARKLGIVVALEIHGQLMASGALARRWVDELDPSVVGVKYDTANCEYYAGVSAVDDLPAVLERVVNVDAKDKLGGRGVWDFPPPGRGHIDWQAVVGLLRGAGYGGPITVEVEFRGEPWPPVDQVNAAMATARATLEPLLR